jgi:hypothetical protein
MSEPSNIVKLHLSGSFGMASNLVMQKIWIIGFFSLKIGYMDSLKWEKFFTNGYFRLHIYLRTNKTLFG